jgi:hypothetical protein
VLIWVSIATTLARAGANKVINFTDLFSLLPFFFL